METKKKKIVAKVIAKNVLVWICTLCMVLCFIPLRSQAAEEDGNIADGASEEQMAVEAMEADVEPQGADDSTPVECTITLKLDDKDWDDVIEVKLVADGEEGLKLESGENGTYTTSEMKKGATYALQISYDGGMKQVNGLLATDDSFKQTCEFHTVKFYDLDEAGSDYEEIESQIVLTDKEALTAPQVTKDGYKLKGWATTSEGSDVITISAPVSKEITELYAVWEEAKDSDTEDPDQSDDDKKEDPTEHEHPLVQDCDETGHWWYCEEEDCDLYWDADGDEPIPAATKAKYFELHDFELEEVTAPSCDTVGSGKYVCKVCAYEVEGEVEVPTRHTPPSKDEEDAFSTDEHFHTYECEVCGEIVKDEHTWYKDQESGTFTCQVCGEEHTEHDYEDVIVKAPTFKIEGEMYSKCRICGETTKSEVIPPIDEHTISWGEADDNTILKPRWQTGGDKLVEYLLTDEEKARVANENLPVQFTLEVVDLSEENINKLDKDLIKAYMDINAKLNGYHVLTYTDINLYKQIGDEPREEIHEVATLISFSVELPDVVQETGRSYAVIRVHEGQPYTVTEPGEGTKGTLMVNTDRFSTYAIVYNGAAIGGTGNGNDGNGNNTGNGSNTGNAGNGSNTGNGNNNNGNTGNNGNSGASGSTSDANNGNTGNQGNATTATDSNNNNSNSGNSSPKTADSSPIVLYMTIAMISAMAYLFLFVTDKDRRMTEQDKDVLIRELTLWARKHGATAKFFMAFAVFCILLYYHTVGKRVKGVAREQA